MSRVYIEKIDKETAFEVKTWGLFKDPKLIGYNYGNLTDFEIMIWYQSLISPIKKYFAIKKTNDDKFIGFLGLKNYNPILKKSLLGIVFDPNYVSKGYGYESMELLLDYYFNELKFKELLLEVNLFNERAIKLYEKLGFYEIGYTTEVFENQKVDLDDRFFEVKRGMIYSKILKMRITKDDYYGL